MSKAGDIEIEVNYTMQWLGRGISKLNIADRNLKKIIAYLITQKSENYEKTIYKLSIRCGIGTRYIQDYLKGLEAWNLLRTYLNGQSLVWEWNSIYEIEKEN